MERVPEFLRIYADNRDPIIVEGVHIHPEHFEIIRDSLPDATVISLLLKVFDAVRPCSSKRVNVKRVNIR